MSRAKVVIIVGAGPAGLTAGLELVRAGHQVTILESDPQNVGGLSRTMSYKGFRFDIGGHRFFSKNTEIRKWWNERLSDDFLNVQRRSRILYQQRFFHYPLRAWDALWGLGIWTSMICIASYLYRKVKPIRPATSFAAWVSNHFGDWLYRIFFKTYTEKVWGIPCDQISSDWASQRIKGLSLGSAILAAISLRKNDEVAAKTLIDNFQYPRMGAGMMWEKTREEFLHLGGKIEMGKVVVKLERDDNRVRTIHAKNLNSIVETWTADEFIVSMPLKDCVLGLSPSLDTPVRMAAELLTYRDFVLVVLIVNQKNVFSDQWIYVHDAGVQVARLQNFNNWSNAMTLDPEMTCLEMEYFCSETDAEWARSDTEWLAVATKEVTALKFLKGDIVDGCVVKVKKAYPVYDDIYAENVKIIREALSSLKNLQMIGRNGMHKYNNQDHSMLTGLLAARNIFRMEKQDPWLVNGDAEYLEQESQSGGRSVPVQIPLVK